ncbi:MAG: hypothetical protein ABS938_15575 [Psychrobacillus psychrodurans]
MPVKNKNIQVIFGTGDIGVGISCFRNGTPGIAQFTEIEPKKIGEEINEEKKTEGSNEALVTLIFNKVESLDVVIYQLQRLKEKMVEDKYELTQSGEIIIK